MFYSLNYYTPAALTLPDAVFLEGETNLAQACGALNLPENSASSGIVLPRPFEIPVTFIAGSAGNLI